MHSLNVTLHNLRKVYEHELETLQTEFEANYLFNVADKLIQIEHQISDFQLNDILDDAEHSLMSFDVYAELRMNKVIELADAVFDDTHKLRDMRHWSAYQFNDWKTSGKVPNNG